MIYTAPTSGTNEGVFVHGLIGGCKRRLIAVSLEVTSKSNK